MILIDKSSTLKIGDFIACYKNKELIFITQNYNHAGKPYCFNGKIIWDKEKDITYIDCCTNNSITSLSLNLIMSVMRKDKTIKYYFLTKEEVEEKLLLENI